MRERRRSEGLKVDPESEPAPLISQEQYHDVSEAMSAFAQAEWEHRDPFQVLLFSADSIETVQSTHPHYFRAGDEDYWSAGIFGGPHVPA
jgi:hypothetical protein